MYLVHWFTTSYYITVVLVVELEDGHCTSLTLCAQSCSLAPGEICVTPDSRLELCCLPPYRYCLTRVREERVMMCGTSLDLLLATKPTCRST